MRGNLTREMREGVKVLLHFPGQADDLGQRSKLFTLGETLDVTAGVQPLGAEVIQALGLTGERERLRVQLPPEIDLTTADRIQLRGYQWSVFHVERWQDYTLAMVDREQGV